VVQDLRFGGLDGLFENWTEGSMAETINEAFLTRFISETFADVGATDAYGYTFFFYGSDHKLPFASLSSADNEYDKVSNLDRPGVFRLNIGLSKQVFEQLFGSAKPALDTYDFTQLDTFMPHPEYAAQHFVCVLNPSEATFERVKTLLADAYAHAARRNARRGVSDV
jgi:hypothetical protein